MDNELDDFLAAQGNPDDSTDESYEHPSMNDLVTAVDNIIRKSMGDLNQLTFQVTAVHPEKKVVWTTTVNGIFISVDTFSEMLSALDRLTD